MPPSTAIELKEQIQTALAAFAAEPLPQAARTLFDTLGYNSQRDERVLKIATPADFIGWVKSANPTHPLTEKDHQELTNGCKSLHFLYQLTDMEVGSALGLSQGDLFDSSTAVDGARIESYLVFVVELSDSTPRTRTSLSRLVRLINKPLPMPALVLFRHGDTLTLGVINRRLHKKASDRDVLEKITLIKDIFFADPLRAHVEILTDLSLGTLHDEYRFHNFVGLHQAWEKRLGSYALNERFYREVANWYFWALNHDEVVLPRSIEEIADMKERDKQRSIFFIRLLTRLIFCWFLQEKRLIPRDMFRHRTAKELLKDFSPKAGSYYCVFLQNLFFATLNQEQDKRDWRKKYQGTRDGNRGVTNLWRYQDLVNDFSRIELLLRDHIPFVNGGLFECLDDQFSDPMVFLDGFSERKDNCISLPNELFFGEEREVDLSTVYDDNRRRREKVRGLIEILSRYKFTVEENTPLEEEIALDPELLGKVFENLLASYNEDTRSTARKALGAFYTPREIVSYMVDDSLSAYLETQLVNGMSANNRRTATEYREILKKLFTSQPEHFHNPFTPAETAFLIAAIGRVKILDPACGSGAFPMGALHRLVDLLQKLDPNNESWKRDRLSEAERYCDILREAAAQREEVEQCEARIEDIRHSFDTRFHALDFARKLYLIENCIYGVDIQPIAVQIAKLRFFIALIVDQHVNQQAPNMGVRPLPNLETKIVAADSLISIDKPGSQMELFESEIRPLRQQLEMIRHDHFNARTPARKARCRERDAQLRADIARLLQQSGWDPTTARMLAAWNPYDQNHPAPFFDSEWMFGLPIGKVKVDGGSPATLLGKLALINETSGQMELTPSSYIESGFDVLIGNPPYVRLQTLKQQDPKLVEYYKAHYDSAKKGNYDLYVVFVEAGLYFLKPSGHLAYILPHKFFNAQYGEQLRALIAKGRYLRHIVHFGDQQVFPGATNYVCLLFLDKSGAETCLFVRSDNYEEWLRTFQGTEGSFPAGSISPAEWNFTVGQGANVFERLQSMPQKLSDVADIFVGLQTSADDVFIFDLIGCENGKSRFKSKALGQEVILEDDLVFPLVSGTDVGSYAPLPSRQYILFPYAVGEKVSIIPLANLRKKFPFTAEYLEKNRARLEDREDGRLRDNDWHGYIYLKNMNRQSVPKICVPRLVDHLHAGADLLGNHFLDNVDVGGVTWKPQFASRSLQYLQALLNSSVLRWFFPHVSAPFRGGFRSANRQFLSQLPIASASTEQEGLITRLVDYLLWLNKTFTNCPDKKTARESLMLGYFEQILNGLVYELYFPEELHSSKLHIFDLVAQANFPKLDTLPESERLDRLRKLFETIYHTDHPLRGALFNLGSLEIVRIIEGQE
ncbi:Eco57I restriction-modification methylase domain-containing protein [Geomobilimonas luticola]|uniref:site-specific DNA-methyltransferase (adenine-specific) n=1 Tax=Geomobilimonas luticola TaxID=1114878 RepID=A0ABS5S853_9BACT|nr:N-6 DNA methylase [Geomobilimonas luticola]MBT0651546.1 Eco57I restriction-modification methylase domain-containing protein [Geomobilimonas luticola]